MSIVRMRKFFQKPMRVRVGRKHLSLGSPVQVIFWGIVIIFVVGAYYSFGPGGGGRGGNSQQAAINVPKVVATVGGQEIQRQAFEQAYQNQLDQASYGGNGSIASHPMMKLQTLNSMINSIVELDAVKKEGVSVSSADISKKRDDLVQQALKTRFPNKRLLKEYLDRKRISYAALQEQIRDQDFGDINALRDQLEVTKLKSLVDSRVTLSDKELQQSYEEVHARHILITVAGERKRIQAQYKAEKKPVPPNLDYDALAKKQADDLLAQLKKNKGANFAALAKQYSDDPGSASKGGDLGWFKRGQMVPEFEKAAFALQPGQLSGVIKTNYGYHIIQVLGRRTDLPKDFAKNKEKYRSQQLAQLQQRAFPTYVQNLRDKMKVVILDPELKAYQELTKGDQDQAMADLQTAIKQDPKNVDAAYQLAMLERQKGEKAQAVTLLENIAGSEDGAKYPAVHMALGDLLSETGKKSEALAQYQSASDWAAELNFTNYMIHAQLQDKFKKLGQKALAAKEKKWLDEFSKHGNMGLGMGGGMPIQVGGQ